ncbi:MAG: threonine/serine exporter [Ruminococcaceae bacterium]|nr:threonine/serine exporter [Oscillospiraceae bacterium]
MIYIYKYIVCLVVIFLVGLSLRTKPMVSFIAGACGAVGYVVYLLCPTPPLGFLLSSLVLALLGEIFARVCKVPSSIFMVLGIYPLVPGIALYKTMAHAFSGDYSQALQTGADALIGIALMAVSFAFVTVSFRIIASHRNQNNKKQVAECEEQDKICEKMI